MESTHIILFFVAELTRIPDPPAPDPATSHMEEDQNISETDYKPSDHERQLGNDKEAVVDSQSHAIENEASVTVESASSSAEDAPKKSYASIVSAQMNFFFSRAFVLECLLCSPLFLGR